MLPDAYSREAFKQGVPAGVEGKTYDANPYLRGTSGHQAWEMGRLTGARERAVLLIRLSERAHHPPLVSFDVASHGNVRGPEGDTRTLTLSTDDALWSYTRKPDGVWRLDAVDGAGRDVQPYTVTYRGWLDERLATCERRSHQHRVAQWSGPSGGERTRTLALFPSGRE